MMNVSVQTASAATGAPTFEVVYSHVDGSDRKVLCHRPPRVLRGKLLIYPTATPTPYVFRPDSGVIGALCGRDGWLVSGGRWRHEDEDRRGGARRGAGRKRRGLSKARPPVKC